MDIVMFRSLTMTLSLTLRMPLSLLKAYDSSLPWAEVTKGLLYMGGMLYQSTEFGQARL